ncbi:MAG: hypothetical protein KGD66_07210 [Candidatus Lokiarchaeota archaeon]|nr:hypothetical protein [Candidatus Lokiarchaeota archaeon]
MKKFLLLILVGFILTSIIALSFTFQASNSFKEFEGDDNDEDEVENSLLENPIEKLSIASLINKIARDSPFINYNLLLKLVSVFNNTYIYVG